MKGVIWGGKILVTIHDPQLNTEIRVKRARNRGECC